METGGTIKQGAYSFLSNSGAVLSEDELLSCSGEFRQTGDGKVFVVQSRILTEKFVCLLDNRKDPWLRVVVSVSSDAEIYFLFEAVLAVCSHEPKERVFWGLWDNICCEGGGCRSHLVCDIRESL